MAVQTRSQRARLVQANDRIDRLVRFRRYRKRYEPSDVAHRHRLRDPQRHTVHVPAHTRRI